MRPISSQRQLIEHRDQMRSKRRSMSTMALRALDSLTGIPFLARMGRHNAQDVKIEKIRLSFKNLPDAFAPTKFLFISDLHIRKPDTLLQSIERCVTTLEYDFCILGGDYVCDTGANDPDVISILKEIVAFLAKRSRVFAILGNHDPYRIAEILEECGIEVLINESRCIRKNHSNVFLTGLDDSSHYESDNIELAAADVSAESFKIMLCHSPKRYAEAENYGYALYLAGDTHGGQVCLPGGIPIRACSGYPRKLMRGAWKYKNLLGYTSRGIGTSTFPVRFFCPPELTLLTLEK
jgi:uncharacterized protein